MRSRQRQRGTVKAHENDGGPECFKCGQVCKDNSNLKNHILSHYYQVFYEVLPDSKPYDCPICDRHSRDRITLVRHYAFTHKKFFEMTDVTPENLTNVPSSAIRASSRKRNQSADATMVSGTLGRSSSRSRTRGFVDATNFETPANGRARTVTRRDPNEILLSLSRMAIIDKAGKTTPSSSGPTNLRVGATSFLQQKPKGSTLEEVQEKKEEERRKKEQREVEARQRREEMLKEKAEELKRARDEKIRRDAEARQQRAERKQIRKEEEIRMEKKKQEMRKQEELRITQAREKERIMREQLEMKRVREEAERRAAEMETLNSTYNKPADATFNRTADQSHVGPSSYASRELAPKPPMTEKDYGLEDLNSGTDTDDADNPKKKVPKWAEGTALSTALLKQCYMGPDVDKIFFTITDPDLSMLFGKRLKRYNKRTSSARWDSTPTSFNFSKRC